MTNYKVGVIGAGVMGRGIAQLAVQNVSSVKLFDQSASSLEQAVSDIKVKIEKLVLKGKLALGQVDVDRDLVCVHGLDELKDCDIVFEAIFEDIQIKKDCLKSLSEMLSEKAIIATNTSSLSVTEIASSVTLPERFMGVHFFNPVPIMELVELVKAPATSDVSVEFVRKILSDWTKCVVEAADSPGFIVNRVARPFYTESLRIVEEGIADPAQIDFALRDIGFKMGPFELMDLIGIDINFAVTESLFQASYFEQRYKPSMLQKSLVLSGNLGRKSGQGFYDYNNGGVVVDGSDLELAKLVSDRVLTMLINEAADAVYYGISDASSIDLAMTKGVNYPMGLCAWADELGLELVLSRMESLYQYYCEDRYRPSPQLRMMVANGMTFY